MDLLFSSSLHAVLARVPRRHGELAFEIVGQHQVEEGIDPVLALLLGDLGDRLAFERLQRRILDRIDADAAPVAEAHRVLEVLAELVAEGRIGIDVLLRRLRLVGEHPLPRREGGEGERVVHVDFAGERQRRGLRPRALGDHRRGAAQRVAHRLGNVVAIEQGDEGHRPAALGQQEIQQLALVVLEHADLAGERDLDGALAALLQLVGVGLQLLAAGVAAGQRLALEAHMLVERGRGEAERAGVDRLADQPGDLRRLLGRRGALHRGLAHDVMAERRQRRDEGEVERRLARGGGVHELGKGLPVPGDALVQHVEGNALDIDQVLHGDLARLGLARRDADAAIAHHHAGHAMPRRGRDRAVPADLRIVMGVRIDEARRHDQPVGIDGALGAFRHLADLGHLAVVDRDIGLIAGAPVPSTTVPFLITRS